MQENHFLDSEGWLCTFGVHPQIWGTSTGGRAKASKHLSMALTLMDYHSGPRRGKQRDYSRET